MIDVDEFIWELATLWNSQVCGVDVDGGLVCHAMYCANCMPYNTGVCIAVVRKLLFAYINKEVK